MGGTWDRGPKISVSNHLKTVSNHPINRFKSRENRFKLLENCFKLPGKSFKFLPVSRRNMENRGVQYEKWCSDVEWGYSFSGGIGGGGGPWHGRPALHVARCAHKKAPHPIRTRGARSTSQLLVQATQGRREVRKAAQLG